MKKSNGRKTLVRLEPSPATVGDDTYSPLQEVIDAIPDAVMVIDLEYGIVMANRTARETNGLSDSGIGLVKCFQASHCRETPCWESGEECPMRDVVAAKRPVRSYHTHYDRQGRAIAVAIDGSPIFDQQGEVVRVVITCRDVTERTAARRILRIGNRHMEMAPLLQEASLVLRDFAECEAAGVRVVDGSQITSICCGTDDACLESTTQHASKKCRCLEVIGTHALEDKPSSADIIPYYSDCRAEFIAKMTDAEREAFGDACSECGCRSLALVPFKLNETPVGYTYIADSRPDWISPERVAKLQRLAVELGSAIERVRVQEALRAARDELESKVEQRTAELTQTNRVLEDEIRERTRLEREILHIITDEQRRIGQELHDGVGQELTGLSYMAQKLVRQIDAGDAAAAETAAEMAMNIPLALTQLRKVVKGLVPLEIGAGDLRSALDVLATNIERQTGIEFRVTFSQCARIRDDGDAIQIYRIVQEAVNNAVKHSEATQIEIEFEAGLENVCLEIRDNGVGIDPASANGPGCKGHGCGLNIMRYRTRVLEGKLEVESVPNEGTTIRCIFPPEICGSFVGRGVTTS